MNAAVHYPVREADGPAHVGTMLDARELRRREPRDNVRRFLHQARAARLAGNAVAWGWNMDCASAWRRCAAEARS